MVSGALTSGRPEPNQIMLEISEVQNLDHNSGARQHLLALEQLGFTLAKGSPWPWKMTESATPVCSGTTPLPELGCRLGQGILLSKPFQAEQLDHLA
jgi:EAL domain-containing protein (putative c-di-GMP-specific phosphodiesterase class I)